MMKKSKVFLMCACAGILLNVCAEGRIWWVDAKWYNQGGIGTESQPLGTIQEAINKATTNDVIKVKPGTYNQGGNIYAFRSSVVKKNYESLDRVYIDKPLRIEATSSNPEETVILGAADDSPPKLIANVYGIGPKAVRCIFIATNVFNVVVKGFTLRNGHSHSIAKDKIIRAGQPGGFTGEGATGDDSKRNYLVDSIIENCAGAHAGAIRYGTAIRCQIRNNSAQGGHSMGSDSTFFHCLFTGNHTDASFNACELYNCTVTDIEGGVNAFPVGGGNNQLRNSIIEAPNASTAFGQSGEYYAANCVMSQPFNSTKDVSCKLGVGLRALIAPLYGDCRPRVKGEAIDLARSSYIETALKSETYKDMPEGLEPWKSLDGVTIDSTQSKMNAGCYQSSVEAVGGVLQFNSLVTANGYTGKSAGLYAFATKDNEISKAKLASEVEAFGCNRTGSTAIGYIFPETDGYVQQFFPPSGICITNEIETVSKIYYVSPSGKDEPLEHGQSSLLPFRTLQYAVDLCEDSVPTMICAAEGTYNEGNDAGEKIAAGHPGRITIPANKLIRFVGAGVGKSVIKGQLDTESFTGETLENAAGRGPKAMRVVACDNVNTKFCFDGFTLCEGASNYDPDDPTKNSAAYYAGLVYCNGVNQWFRDCEFLGGVAYRSSMIHSGGNSQIIRCHVKPTYQYAGHAIRGVKLVSSLVDATGALTVTNGSAIGTGTKAYYTTLVGGVASLVSADVYEVVNCIFYNSTKRDYTLNSTSLTKFSGNLIYKADFKLSDEVKSAHPEFKWTRTEESPFVNFDGADYKVLASSDAVSAGQLPNDEWTIYPCDYSGVSRKYVDGSPIVGCMANAQVKITVATADNISISPKDAVGSHYIGAGEEFVVTYSANGRNPCGLIINGVTNLTTPVTFAYSVPETGIIEKQDQPFVIEPIVQNYWYVDPHGDNSDGFTPETAKQTLIAMNEVMLFAGDTVHVAAGTYDSGEFDSSFGGDSYCRLLVKSGVTYIGDEGPENTIIVGEGGVRAAVVEAGGVLKGFTLTGTTLSGDDDSGKAESLYGGGVRGAIASGTDVSKWSIVRECIITNNCALRGGAAFGAVLVNCICEGNSAKMTSSGIYSGRAYGTYFGQNVNSASQLARYCYGMVNCTIDAMTNAEDTFPDWVTGATLDNCLVLCETTGKNTPEITANHSIFVTGKYQRPINDPLSSCIWLDNVEAAKVGLYGKLIKGSPAIDKGNNSFAHAILNSCDLLAGVQRIYNGRVDVGACEYDWRGNYKNDLGKGNYSVESAAPQVVETAEKMVLIREGDFGLLIPRIAGARRRCTVTAQVTGSGVLTVLTNGVPYAVYTSEAGEQKLSFGRIANVNDERITLSYEKADKDTDAVGALLTGVTTRNAGFLIGCE